MSRRLWGACASEQGLLGTALGPSRLSLRLTDTGESPVGWGIGFYERGEPLVRKRPLEDRPELDLLGVIAETRSDLLIGHVREPTVGNLRSANTHPFRYRQWLFAHSGTIRRYGEIESKLRDALPAFLHRGLQGETDSEVFFHLVLAFLHDARKLDKPRLEPRVAAEAVVKAVAMVDELAGDDGSSFNIIMSNGAFLVALRRSPNALFYQTYTAPGRDEIRPRAVIIACERTVVGEGWTEIPSGSTMTIDHDLTVDVTTF